MSSQLKRALELGILVSALGFAHHSLAGEQDPVQVKIALIPPGTLIKVKVNSLPVFIMARKPGEIGELRTRIGASSDPVQNCEKCDPVLRSISPEYFVVWGFNSESGCELIYIASATTGWQGQSIRGKGGFIDKCAQAEFDLSGRRLDGTPNGKPLAVPRYSIVDDTVIIDPRTQ